MIPKLKSRRGMTLAELMVSVAVVAIMAVMVVSFATLLSGRTADNNENLAFQQDLALAQAQVEGWMAANTGETLSLDNKAVTAEEGDTLSFAYHTLTAGENSITLDTVESVTFELVDKNPDYLLFCTVTSTDGQTYTFCVNPRIGETV